MKKILIIASLALCCSLLASCEDFLDTKKYGAKTDWETQEDVEKALVALFSFNTNDSEGVTGRGITWFECCSDDMTVGRPQGEAEDIRNFRMSPSNGRDVKNNWKIMYEVNAKANNIIKVVPTMNLDNAFKTKATGTAYFFRGFAMLWLSPYYGDNGPTGGIPIILDTTEPAAMARPRPAPYCRTTTRSSATCAKPANACLSSRSSHPKSTACPTRPQPGPSPHAQPSMPHSSTPNTTTRSSKCATR